MSPSKPNESAMTPATLKGLLDASNTKKKAAAVLLGVSRQTVHRWLSGQTPINKANALLIRETFLKK